MNSAHTQAIVPHTHIHFIWPEASNFLNIYPPATAHGTPKGRRHHLYVTECKPKRTAHLQHCPCISVSATRSEHFALKQANEPAADKA